MSRPPGTTYAPGSPFRPLPLPVFRPRGCGQGAHLAMGTTDREGQVLWVCQRCPAFREHGDPRWWLPSRIFD